MVELEWNSPYFDRRSWILDHMDVLHIDHKEALVLLLVDFYNEQHIPIDHDHIKEKLKISAEDVEAIFMSLSEKGYLEIEFKNNVLTFNIEGVYVGRTDDIEQTISRSLLEEFEMEFKRTLSSFEMQRILDLADAYDARMVICALNEAAVNEKRSLDYIERILVSWKEKGLSVEDVENGKR